MAIFKPSPSPVETGFTNVDELDVSVEDVDVCARWILSAVSQPCGLAPVLIRI